MKYSENQILFLQRVIANFYVSTSPETFSNAQLVHIIALLSVAVETVDTELKQRGVPEDVVNKHLLESYQRIEQLIDNYRVKPTVN